MENKKKILLVEDDVFIVDIYRTKLESEKFEVATAGNGMEAMSKLEKFIPDLILLDIVMPYMNGMDFLKEIKKDARFENIPVIMLSNLSDQERMDDAKKYGVKGYLIKSHFTPSEVVEKINILLSE